MHHTKTSENFLKAAIIGSVVGAGIALLFNPYKENGARNSLPNKLIGNRYKKRSVPDREESVHQYRRAELSPDKARKPKKRSRPIHRPGH